MKLSIIVPVYNASDFLARCLDSLVDQTLESDYEIVLVDDASTDNSYELCKDYQEKYPELIKVEQHAQNKKQGAARNTGLAVAKGEYIAFVDADDYVSLSMYEKLLTLAFQENADIVDSDYYQVSFTGEKEMNRSIAPELLSLEDAARKKQLIMRHGRMWTKIFKRSLLADNDIRFIEKLFYEDNEFLPIVMCYVERVVKVDEPLYFYMTNSESTSNSLNNYAHFDRLSTAKKMIENAKSRKIYDEYKEEFDYKFIELFYINTIIFCLTRFNPVETDKIREIRAYMKKEYPDYKKNQYFSKRKLSYGYILGSSVDVAPKATVSIYKLGKRIVLSKRVKILLKKRAR